MIGFADGYKLDIHARSATQGAWARTEYYVQIHCWCGSTLSSGEYMPTSDQATALALEGIEDHEKHGKHAGRFARIPCVDCGTHSYVRFESIVLKKGDANKEAPVCRNCSAIRDANTSGE